MVRAQYDYWVHLKAFVSVKVEKEPRHLYRNTTITQIMFIMSKRRGSKGFCQRILVFALYVDYTDVHILVVLFPATGNQRYSWPNIV